VIDHLTKWFYEASIGDELAMNVKLKEDKEICLVM
jgi:hypothetical protein